MPSISAAAAIAELKYLDRVAIEIDADKLKERISPVFDVFTQHLSDRRKNRVLEKIIDSTYMIGENESKKIHQNILRSVGLRGHDVAYKRVIGAIEVSEKKIDEKGYFEWALIMKLGDMNFFNRIINNYRIAANAVASFYRDMSSLGLPSAQDEKNIWTAKYFIPNEFQGKKTLQAAYKIGNRAKQMEHDNSGTGLQYIYELTR